MLNNKYTWFVAFAAMATQLQLCSTIDVSPDKLTKNYAKINNYLEKNVHSDDPASNMKEVREFLKKNSSKFTYFLTEKSLVETFKLLNEFADGASDKSRCGTWGRLGLMNLADSGLADISRLHMPNYPLRRLDKLIQQYAFENVLHCGNTDGFPNLSYGYKQIAYDNINSLLVDALPNVDEVEANMAKAEELLKGMPDGALADALRQFLQLKLLVDENTCNEKGYETLLRNDLATKLEAVRGSTTPSRRVGKVVQHYAKKHEHLCRPIVPRLIKSELKRLDPDTYRIVLGLVAAQFLSQAKYDMLVQDLNLKEVDENFSTPLLVDIVDEQIRKSGRNRKKVELFLKQTSSPTFTDPYYYYYVKAASVKDPLSRYLDAIMGAQRGFDEAQLGKLLGKYLFEPCSRFLNVFERLVQADNYGANMNRDHVIPDIDKVLEEISYHIVRAGYSTCKYFADKQEDVILSIKNASQKQRSVTHKSSA